MIQIDFARYTERRGDSEPAEVDAAYVRRFLDAAPFFDNLVDAPEKHEQHANGVITVTQRTPDGDTRVTTFEPVA